MAEVIALFAAGMFIVENYKPIIFICASLTVIAIILKIKKKQEIEEEIERREAENRYQREQMERRIEESRIRSEKRLAEAQECEQMNAFLENGLSKLEDARKNAVHASLLSKRIDEYTSFLENFEREHPDKSYLINSHYRKPLEYAKNKLKKMQQYEASLQKNAPSSSKRKKQSSRKPIPTSMRYDVLQRDNFRCCICGRSAADGMTLHVDHIIPVSKGGATSMDNLRTLCSECNLGKSDKIETVSTNSATNVSSPQLDCKETDNFTDVAELISVLNDKGISYCDKTALGGRFWIYSNPETDTWVSSLILKGRKPEYAKASKSLKGQPGWYI